MIRHAFAALLLLGLATAGPSRAESHASPVARRDTTSLGMPWVRYTTRDHFDRTITFYVSRVPDSLADRELPLVLVIGGSGGQSIWIPVGDRVGGGLQNLVRRAAAGRVRLVTVEKPGVEYLRQLDMPGSAVGSSATFRREHTRPRWTEANAAALRAALTLPGIDRTRVLVVGHSEGATIACDVAGAERAVTHAASLSGGGASQLFDLVMLQGRARAGDSTGAGAERQRAVLAEYRDLLKTPDDPDRLWLGHPHRRWSSFLATNDLEPLLRTRARVYLAHGTADEASAIESFDWLCAELTARGRPITIDRVVGAGHDFEPAGADARAGNGAALEAVLRRVLAWFLSP